VNATQSHARLVREIAASLGAGHENAAADLGFAADELERLDGLINSPHTAEFLEAVRTEAAHQRERWGTEHDAGKDDTDWLFLVGYLAGKAVHSGNFADGDPAELAGGFIERHREKRLHHIITAAAACLNWHAARSGVDQRMRPGIAPPL
jgi:hypothetical protein